MTKKECCTGNCNQGRDCPLRAGNAKPAAPEFRALDDLSGKSARAGMLEALQNCGIAHGQQVRHIEVVMTGNEPTERERAIARAVRAACALAEPCLEMMGDIDLNAVIRSVPPRAADALDSQPTEAPSDDSIEAAALKHVATSWGALPVAAYRSADYKKTEQFRRLKAFALELLYSRAPAAQAASEAARDVLAERKRQVDTEGYDREHDDAHPCGEIAAFAALYAMPPPARDWPATGTGYGDTFGAALCPVDWHPNFGDRRRELVKAGALLLAEIERIDRAAGKAGAV